MIGLTSAIGWPPALRSAQFCLYCFILPHILTLPSSLLSGCLTLETRIRGHIAGTPPPPPATTVHAFLFIVGRAQHFCSSLVDPRVTGTNMLVGSMSTP